MEHYRPLDTKKDRYCHDCALEKQRKTRDPYPVDNWQDVLRVGRVARTENLELISSETRAKHFLNLRTQWILWARRHGKHHLMETLYEQVRRYDAYLLAHKDCQACGQSEVEQTLQASFLHRIRIGMKVLMRELVRRQRQQTLRDEARAIKFGI